MSNHEFGVGVGILIFSYAVVEFSNTVEVVAEVGIDIPGEVSYAEYVCCKIEFDSGVDHSSHIFPAVAIAIGLSV